MQRGLLRAAVVAAAILAALQLAACDTIAIPLIQQRLLGSQAAHHRVYHSVGDEATVLADPKPRQQGGQCGPAACDDIPFPTPWSKVRRRATLSDPSSGCPEAAQPALAPVAHRTSAAWWLPAM